jgi:hypothetical protein
MLVLQALFNEKKCTEQAGHELKRQMSSTEKTAGKAGVGQDSVLAGANMPQALCALPPMTVPQVQCHRLFPPSLWAPAASQTRLLQQQVGSLQRQLEEAVAARSAFEAQAQALRRQSTAQQHRQHQGMASALKAQAAADAVRREAKELRGVSSEGAD